MTSALFNMRKIITVYRYRWTWIWQTQWDQENWSVICKIRRIRMTNTRYPSDWDQAYRPSYAKICRTVVRHIQVHLYIYFIVNSSIKVFYSLYGGKDLNKWIYWWKDKWMCIKEWFKKILCIDVDFTCTLSSGLVTFLSLRNFVWMKPLTPLSSDVLTPIAWPGQPPASKWFHTYKWIWNIRFLGDQQ